MCKVAEELTGDTETFVDVEGAVEVGVVDETFPADGCTGFLWGKLVRRWWLRNGLRRWTLWVVKSSRGFR